MGHTRWIKAWGRNRSCDQKKKKKKKKKKKLNIFHVGPWSSGMKFSRKSLV